MIKTAEHRKTVAVHYLFNPSASNKSIYVHRLRSEQFGLGKLLCSTPTFLILTMIGFKNSEVSDGGWRMADGLMAR
jgi:hypothetical protein